MSFFTDLAQLTVGISTPHYLYLNEATRSLIQNGSAEATAEALEAIDGNREAVAESALPACEKPESLLLHLSQSNAYHRQLAADVRLATKVFNTYRALSGMPFHERLATDPKPALQSQLYDPATYDPVRGVIELWSSMDCLKAWSRLPATDNTFENIMDLFQPPMHLLVGGLMAYFALMEQVETDPMCRRGAVFDWFQLMQHGALHMIRHSVDFVEPRIHDLWTGAVIAATSSGAEPPNLIDAQQIGQLLTVLTGIDCGLHILSQALLSRTEKMAMQTGTMARQLQEQHTTPLLDRIMAAAGGGAEDGVRAPSGPTN